MENGCQRCRPALVEDRGVDAAPRPAPVQHQRDLVPHPPPPRRIEARGGRGHVRGQDHVVHREERVARHRRLLLQHVEAGARDPPFLQRLDERRLVHRRPAPGIDEQRGRLHLPEVLRRHHASGVGGGRRVHGDDVRALQHLAQARRLDAVRAHHELLDVRVIGQHPHAERPRAHGDGARHVAEGDEAERLAHEPRDLQELRSPFLPPALAHHPVLHDEPPERGEDQHHRVVGHFLDEGVGHIGHRDAARGGRGHVDRIHAHAAERDDLAPLHPVDHALGDGAPLGVERIRIARRRDELVFGARGDLEDLRVERAHALPSRDRTRHPLPRSSALPVLRS